LSYVRELLLVAHKLAIAAKRAGEQNEVLPRHEVSF